MFRAPAFASESCGLSLPYIDILGEWSDNVELKGTGSG
jgi:hypothetical protein